jgi:hypothetical protein
MNDDNSKKLVPGVKNQDFYESLEQELAKYFGSLGNSKKLHEDHPDLGYCVHDWKQYTGFNDSFMYCTKCNEKYRPDR